jgi:hypothetical protein
LGFQGRATSLDFGQIFLDGLRRAVLMEAASGLGGIVPQDVLIYGEIAETESPLDGPKGNDGAGAERKDWDVVSLESIANGPNVSMKVQGQLIERHHFAIPSFKVIDGHGLH